MTTKTKKEQLTLNYKNYIARHFPSREAALFEKLKNREPDPIKCSPQVIPVPVPVVDLKPELAKYEEDAIVEIVMEIPRPKRQNRFKFCPRCANLIVLNDKSDLPGFRLQCPTCPFNNPITKRIVYTKIIPKTEDTDQEIFDASKSDEHRQRTQVVCPDCNHTEAFFYQMQTRSADEPMTNFYECTNKQCKKNWRD